MRAVLPALLLCLSSSAAAAAGAGGSPPPPHVVVLLADDLGFGDCGFTGVSDVRTPHIDALLARGVRATRYYGQPVCSPSRAALHTGRLPLAYGLQTYVIDPAGVDYGLNLNETTLPQLLRDRAGYDTHAIGKASRARLRAAPARRRRCRRRLSRARSPLLVVCMCARARPAATAPPPPRTPPARARSGTWA